MAIIGAILAATIGVYARVWSHDFVYDDIAYVSENQHVLNGFTKEGLLWAFTTTYTANWHPVTWLSLMLDCELFGSPARACHLINLLYHVLNTFLLYWVLRRMTGAFWPSALVAGLFALHPVHVESVAWISERKDVLSTFFWLLTMGAYALYVEGKSRKWYGAMILLFAAGLMAKPMLVTLPFVLLLLDYWPLGRWQPGKAHAKIFPAAKPSGRKETQNQQRRPQDIISNGGYQKATVSFLLAEKLPLFLFSGAACVVTFLAQRGAGVMKSLEVLDLQTRIGNALLGYVKYLGKIFWPRGLAAFYPHPRMVPLTQEIAAGAALLVITIILIWFLRRYRCAAVGWLWYLGTLIPVIGLVQVGIQGMADRYCYVPSIGFFIIWAWGVYDLLSRRRFGHTAFVVIAGGVLSVLSVVTWFQVDYWHNSVTLWSHALAVTRDNFVAHNNLGVALEERRQIDQAVEHFKAALAINPVYEDALTALSPVLLRQGLSDEVKKYAQELLKRQPHHPLAQKILGDALYRQQKYDEAIDCYKKALQGKPDFIEAAFNLALALEKQGKPTEAIAPLEQALVLRPDYVAAREKVAALLFARQEYNEAASHYARLVELQPQNATAHNNLGSAFTMQNKLAEAVEQYQKALSLRPDYVDAYMNLGTALTKMNKFKEAVEQYEQALKIQPNHERAQQGLKYARQKLSEGN